MAEGTFKTRAKNPTLALARQVAAARLKRSGFVTLKTLKRRPGTAAVITVEPRFPAELVEKLAGG